MQMGPRGHVVRKPHSARVPVALFTADGEVDLGMLQFCGLEPGMRPPAHGLFYLTSFNLQVDRVEKSSRLEGQLPSPGLFWARVREGFLRFWWSSPPTPHIFFDSLRRIAIATSNRLSLLLDGALPCVPPRPASSEVSTEP
jgi:hypothetical protein